jgi:hypothetical protein
MGRLVKVTEGGEVSVLNESFGHPKCEERAIPCQFFAFSALALYGSASRIEATIVAHESLARYFRAFELLRRGVSFGTGLRRR